ncbi:MAG: hypothetical protein M1825_000071 [Sarcosagium campestre]|nr:MAG: hypothetical protein M1825_000071 [Sarcosagium campestre]
MAIEVWSKVKMGEKCNLEQALAAFDMFLLHDRRGDFNDISKDLDELSNRYKEENVGSEEETPRNQALSLAQFVRSHNLTGVEDESNYRDLQNNFIGLALRHEDHPSLPLISTAIYCCLAQRLDIDARPCGFFPFHVHTIVRPPSGVNLDGQALADDSDADSMYLDPFATAEEVPSSNLLAQLTELGVGDNMRALYLGASPVGDVVLRSSRNILHSIQDSLGNGLPLAIARPGASASTKTMDIESALCSSLWASLLFGRQASDNRFAITGPEEMNHLQGVIRNLETCFPEDLTLVEENLAPQFRGLPAYDQLMSSIHAIRLSDTVPKTRRPRGSELVRQTVRFKVGQVFRHNRHDYLAIITGWDVCSEKNGRWAPTRNLDRLPEGGKEQSFYHAVVEDTTVRYVAQSSIEIVDIQEPSRIMMELAGKYFKRWDRDSRSFVSNMKDEYPED